jgi:hypothetical protein
MDRNHTMQNILICVDHSTWDLPIIFSTMERL